MALQNRRSNTANKRPTASGMVDGQVAINTNATNPGLFFKDAGDGIRKVGPVFIGSSAPNSSPAAGGSTGHSIGEQWLDTSGSRYVVKTWDGTAWRDDDSNYLQLTGGALSGALTIDNAANIAALDLKFDGDTDTGFYAPAANTLGFVGGGTERLRIDSSGKFGFGTSTVSTAKFTFNSGGTNEVARFESTDPGAYLSFKDSTSSSVNFIEGGADQLSFGTNSNERLRIDSSGNVGIGTSSPVANTPLTLQGPSGYTDTLWLKSTGTNIDSRINFGPTGTGNAQINNATGTDIAFQVSGSEKLRIDSFGRVGIGTTSPENNLHIADTLGPTIRLTNSTGSDGSYIGRILTGDAAGSFFAGINFIKHDTNDGEIRFRTKVDGTNQDTVTIVDGRVGIGTLSPASKAHIKGGSLTVEHNSPSTGTGQFNINSESNSQVSLSYDDQGHISIGTASAPTGQTGFSEKVRIDSSGRLLLGTTTEGEGDADNLTIADTGNCGITLRSGTSSKSSIHFSDATSGTGEYDGFIAYNQSNRDLKIGTASSTRLTIDSSGDVGIGTTSPSKALTLRGEQFIETNSTAADSGNGIYWQSTTSGWTTSGAHAAIYGKRVDGNNGYLRFDTRLSGTTAERMRIDSSGNVGIGTTSPGQLLHLEGSNAGANIQVQSRAFFGGQYSNHFAVIGSAVRVDTGQTTGMVSTETSSGNGRPSAIRFGAGAIEFHSAASSTAGAAFDSERMRIDSSGNVGIGATPGSQEQLLVHGGDNSIYVPVARSDSKWITIHSGGTDPAIFCDTGGAIRFGHGSSRNAFSTERMRIDSSGRLLVGTAATKTTYTLEVVQDSGANLALVCGSSVSAANGPYQIFTRSRGTTSSPSVVQNGDTTGVIEFRGYSGAASAYRTNAAITGAVDGTPDSGGDTTDMPGRLVFSTTAEGNNSPTERVRIDSSGRLLVGVTSGSGDIGVILNKGGTARALLARVSQPTASGGLGSLAWGRTNGEVGCTIGGIADGNWSGSSYPTRLTISTVRSGETSLTERLRIHSGGKLTVPGVYAGTTTGGAAVYVESDGDLLRYTSSLKYKTDVETIEDARADAILNCRPVWYRSKCENDIKTEGAEKSDWGWYGFIAEEVAEIEPRLVSWATKDAVEQEDGSVESVERDPADYEAEGGR